MTPERSTATQLAAKQLDISVRELCRTIAERVLHIDGGTDKEDVFRLFLEREE